MPIVQRHQLQDPAFATEREAQVVLALRELAGDFCADVDAAGRLRRVSRRGLRFLGCPPDAAPELNVADVVHGEDAPAALAALARCFGDAVQGLQPLRVPLRVLRHLVDPVATTMTLQRIGREQALVCWQDEETVRGLKAAVRSLRESDLLTGLLGRDAFAASLSQAPAASSAHLLLVDAADWPATMRVLGRAAASEAIVEAAGRIAQSLGGTRLLNGERRIARLEEMRFAAWLEGEPAAVERAAADLLRVLGQPVATGLMPVGLSPRVVLVALAGGPDGARGDSDKAPPDPLAQAELVMDAALARRDAGPVTVRLGELPRSRSQVLCRAMTDAFGNGEFEQRYEPIRQLHVDPALRPLFGFAALLRWRREGGPVEPAEFLPLAQASGLRDSLESWSLRLAAARLRDWSDGAATFVGTVRIGDRQFDSPDFAQRVVQLAQESAIDPSRLVLAVPEATLMQDVPRAETRLADLRAAGLRVAIDDFGADRSALPELARLPVSLIRLHPRFLAGVPDDVTACAIASGLLRICAEIGIETIACGVQTAAQLDWLAAEGCRFAQGEAVGDALDGDAFRALVGAGAGAGGAAASGMAAGGAADA